MNIRVKVLSVLFSILMVLIGCAPKNINVETQDDPCLQSSGDNHFILCEPLNFKVDNNKFQVPKGFETSLSSLPYAGSALMALFKNGYLPSGIIHDYLYDCRSPFSRIEADAILYHGLISDGIEEKKAKALYYVMLASGWHYYSGDKQCNIGAIANE